MKILYEEKSIENFVLKYYLSSKKQIIEGREVTTFDIRVEKINGTAIEISTCPGISSSLDTAKKIFKTICQNEVFPENLIEIVEEYLEVVL